MKAYACRAWLLHPAFSACSLSGLHNFSMSIALFYAKLMFFHGRDARSASSAGR
jgi:hypothetical protein